MEAHQCNSQGGRFLVLAFVACAIGSGTVMAQLPLPATLEDFFQTGTQPLSLPQAIEPASICAGCHGSPDVVLYPILPFEHWKTSAMAQAMRDPIFHAALAVANQDVDFAGSFCFRCHSPGGWLSGRSTPPDGSALTDQDFDGVTCDVCHRMVDPFFDNLDNPADDEAILDALTMDPNNAVPTVPNNGSYIIDPDDNHRGPFDLVPGFPLHGWRRSPFHHEALLCATCHENSNPTLLRVGGAVPSPSDTYVPTPFGQAHPTQDKFDMFPEQRTYSEWSNSEFALGPVDMGGRFGGNDPFVSACQDCHMPKAFGRACVIDGLTIERPDVPIHDFLGASTWMLDTVINLDQTLELYSMFEASGLTQDEVDIAKARNVAFLQSAADMDVSIDCSDTVTVRVTNQCGHKLPTGYPEGRRIWINVKFLDDLDQVITEHGFYDAVTADLTTGDTKVYESKLGIDATMAAATGEPVGETMHLVLGNTILKDNRIPPRGFTNAAFEAVQAAPIGATYADGQNWDDTGFPVPVGAVAADVTLFYQTASKEYIEFLRDANTSNNRGDILHAQWVATGMGAPVQMNQVTFVFPDCDANGSLDPCEIAALPALDTNTNGFLDLCEVPAASAVGSRYFSVTPQPVGVADAQMALLVTSPDLPCLVKYIDVDHSLVDNAVFQTVDAWGSFFVAEVEVVPEVQYDIRAEFMDGSLSAITSFTTDKWGDADRSQTVNLIDAQAIVKIFQGLPSAATPESADVDPCDPNQVVNLIDAQKVVKVFQGQTYQDFCGVLCP